MCLIELNCSGSCCVNWINLWLKWSNEKTQIWHLSPAVQEDIEQLKYLKLCTLYIMGQGDRHIVKANILGCKNSTTCCKAHTFWAPFWTPCRLKIQNFERQVPFTVIKCVIKCMKYRKFSANYSMIRVFSFSHLHVCTSTYSTFTRHIWIQFKRAFLKYIQTGCTQGRI